MPRIAYWAVSFSYLVAAAYRWPAVMLLIFPASVVLLGVAWGIQRVTRIQLL